MVNIDLIKIPKIKLCGNVIGVRANLIKIWKCRCFCQLCVISQVCLSFTGFMVIKFGNYAYTQFIFLGIVFSGIVFLNCFFKKNLFFTDLFYYSIFACIFLWSVQCIFVFVYTKKKSGVNQGDGGLCSCVCFWFADHYRDGRRCHT